MKLKIGLIIGLTFYFGSVIAQSPVASFPFEQYGDHSFIKVKVNGSEELDFIFDTGDGLTVLNINRAQELGMTSGSTASTTSAEGTISGKLLKHQELTISGAPIHDVKIYETGLLHLEMSIGRDIDGIIGYDILKNFVVSMDYDKMQMDLYNAAGYVYHGKGTAMDINLTSYIPHIYGTFTLSNGDSLNGEFFVDTGAKASIDFNTPFVEANNLTSKIGDSYVYLVAGLGKKEFEHHRGKVPSFGSIGFSFTDVPVGLSHAKSGIQNHKKVAGILGSELLRKFNIVYNYAAKKMFWEKNESYSKPFPINASGIELQLSKDKSQVLAHRIFENSPASAAGIKLNAVIESVNGKNAIELGLADIRKTLSEDGAMATVVVDGETIELKLKSML